MRLKVLSLLAALLLVMPVHAQDDEHPLLQLLSYVPADIATVGAIPASYADYSALFVDEEGASLAETEADFVALSDDERGVWIQTSTRLGAGPTNLFEHFLDWHEAGREALGFTLFDVDRSLTFGQPPDFGTIVQGTFDPGAILTAFETQGYQVTEIAGLPAVCNPEDCAEGMSTDLRGRNTAIPFGGELGRKEPMIVLPDVLLDSPVLERVEGMAAAGADEVDSLADIPAYRAAVEAITAGEGTLVQASFLNPAEMSAPVGMDADQQAAIDERLARFDSLPPYELAVIAERSEADGEIALFGLVYADEATAQAAADELAARLGSYVSLRTEGTTPIFEERGITIGDASVVETADGLFVALVPLVGAADSEEPVFAFRLLAQMHSANDALFLTPGE